jgi:hypothetical protein
MTEQSGPALSLLANACIKRDLIIYLYYKYKLPFVWCYLFLFPFSLVIILDLIGLFSIFNENAK